MLVVQRFFLDLRALVHAFHGAEHTATFGDTAELGEHRLLHQFRELFDDERTLQRVLVLGEAQLLVDDELDRQSPANTLFGGRGDGLVVRVGVQAVAVVGEGEQGLQGRANVVELNLASVE